MNYNNNSIKPDYMIHSLKRTVRMLAVVFVVAFFNLHSAHAIELPATADETTKETLAAAHNGDVEAMYTIALYLLDEGQLDKPDYLPLAFGWSLNAARRGHAQSAELTGVMYRRGIGIDRNFVKQENGWSVL